MSGNAAALPRNHSAARPVSATPREPTTWLTDDALVRALAAGEQRAFDHFADEVLPKVHRYALRLTRGDTETARDVVQSGVSAAMHRLDTFRGDSALVTWLCSCVHNELRMLRRSATFRREHVADAETIERAGSSTDASRYLTSSSAPDESAIESEKADNVHQALDAMPERYAQALEWKYLEDHPVRRIADWLDLSEKAAESLLTRSRAAFRKQYQQLTGASAPPLRKPGSTP